MSDGTPIVFVVDDDISVRESLELLIRGGGLAAGSICVRAGISQPFTGSCSELPRA